jgi:hypothetical protein
MNRPSYVVLLASVVAASPLAAPAQEPTMMQQPPQAMGGNLPQIDVVRVQRIDPAAPKFQFRLSDGVVDLMKAFSLDSFEGIGSVWKMEPPTETFDARYGRW